MSRELGGGDSLQENWDEVYKDINKSYTEAYYSIDKAIKLDEEGKNDEAIPLYEAGLSVIDKALNVPINEPSKPNVSWEKTFVMIQKLRKTRKEVLIRLDNIKSKPESPAVNELPPSYEEIMSGSKAELNGVNQNGNNFQLPGSSKTDVPYIPPSATCDPILEVYHLPRIQEDSSNPPPITYSDLSHQLKAMKLDKDEEILFSCDNVLLCFISPDGRVSSTSEPNRLIIARVHDETCNILDEALLNIVSDISREIKEGKKKRHRHHHLRRRRHRHKERTPKEDTSDKGKRNFLQVGSWIYPLIPEVSPCLRSDFGAFILPDINSDVPGASVGIIVEDEQANNQIHEILSSILNDVSEAGRSRRSVVEDSSNRFSSKIVRGATYLARNLVRGAGSTARFLDSSTPKIIDRINPQPEPQPINPTLQKTVEVAKVVSGKALSATDYLATKVGMATSALGRYLSPYIQKQGTRLLASTMSMTEEEASQKMNSILNATSDAAEGISAIYCGLDTAASILGRSLTNNTVQIIEYKYGQPAGALTNDAIATLGNVYYANRNFRYLRPKSIAKAAVRGAGAAVLEDIRHSDPNSKPHDEFRGSGPGDGCGFLPRN